MENETFLTERPAALRASRCKGWIWWCGWIVYGCAVALGITAVFFTNSKHCVGAHGPRVRLGGNIVTGLHEAGYLLNAIVGVWILTEQRRAKKGWPSSVNDYANQLVANCGRAITAITAVVVLYFEIHRYHLDSCGMSTITKWFAITEMSTHPVRLASAWILCDALAGFVHECLDKFDVNPETCNEAELNDLYSVLVLEKGELPKARDYGWMHKHPQVSLLIALAIPMCVTAASGVVIGLSQARENAFHELSTPTLVILLVTSGHYLLLTTTLLWQMATVGSACLLCMDRCVRYVGNAEYSQDVDPLKLLKVKALKGVLVATQHRHGVTLVFGTVTTAAFVTAMSTAFPLVAAFGRLMLENTPRTTEWLNTTRYA